MVSVSAKKVKKKCHACVPLTIWVAKGEWKLMCGEKEWPITGFH